MDYNTGNSPLRSSTEPRPNGKSRPSTLASVRRMLAPRRNRVLCIATLILFTASILLAYGASAHALALCLMGCMLLGAALTDLAERVIPNELIIAGIAAWAVTLPFLTANPHASGLEALILAATNSPALAALANGLTGGAGTVLLLLALSLALDALTGAPNLGGGDLKLFFVTGLFLGFAVNLLNMLVACLFALVRRPASGDGTFPFAPAIAAATWFTLLFGPSILQALFS